MGFWAVKEPVEYSGEVSKTKGFLSGLILIFITMGFAYLVFAKLIPYQWKEFTDYEQTAREIKNHWAIWAVYDIGGKWLVCSIWGLLGGFMLYSGIIILKQLIKTLTNKK